MLNVLSLNNMLESLVPITRFNRGEANKIFDEVRESGCKVVVKNNVPTCVLLTPELYKMLIDMIEDQNLFELAEERLKQDSGIVYTEEEVYRELGIQPDGNDEIPMEYGVDFE
ncbi:MAG: type II toxin-antitoxin system Phd/YefM family antitoxin [Clostridiales bacterium]|nr:type II toxin-antitoxin system Phd/YefM family antitoxin [Clostridiales bacterium]